MLRQGLEMKALSLPLTWMGMEGRFPVKDKVE